METESDYKDVFVFCNMMILNINFASISLIDDPQVRHSIKYNINRLANLTDTYQSELFKNQDEKYVDLMVDLSLLLDRSIDLEERTLSNEAYYISQLGELISYYYKIYKEFDTYLITRHFKSIFNLCRSLEIATPNSERVNLTNKFKSGLQDFLNSEQFIQLGMKILPSPISLIP